MFDFVAGATKKTVGQAAIAAGTGLLVYNKFERPSEPMGLPLALIGGGLVVLALTASEPAHDVARVSGAAEDEAAAQDAARQAAIRRAQSETDYTPAEEKKVNALPWIVGGAALVVAALYAGPAIVGALAL